MSVKPIVMMDIDGVLADFILAFTTLGHELLGTPITRTVDQPSWNGFPGMTRRDVETVWNEISSDRSTEFWLNLEPLYAGSGLHNLDTATTLYFVTNRPGFNVRRTTRYWLQKTMLLAYTPTVIVSPNKGEMAKALGATHALDDKAANASCIDWITKGQTKSYLLNRKYNDCPKDFLASGVQRVQTIDEFVEEVLK